MYVTYIPLLQKEGSFAQACSFIDDGIAADLGITGDGVRTGDASDTGNGVTGGRGASSRHNLGHRGCDAGALYAGGLRYAGGRLLPDEECRERGGEDSGNDGNRDRGLLGRGLRVHLRRW